MAGIVLIAGSGNQHDIEAAIGLVIYTLIELKWSPISRIKDYESKFFWGKTIPGYKMLSAGVSAWFFLSLWFFVRFSGPLVAQRVFNFGPQPFGAGYWITWFVIACAVARWGYDNIVSGFMAAGLLGSIHEGLWYIFYYFAYPNQIGYEVQYYPFMVLMVVLISCYFVLARHGAIRYIGTERILLMITMVTAFDLAWLSGGFPVSIYLYEIGPLFGNVPEAIIETESWIVLGVVGCFGKQKEATKG